MFSFFLDLPLPLPSPSPSPSSSPLVYSVCQYKCHGDAGGRAMPQPLPTLLPGECVIVASSFYSLLSIFSPLHLLSSPSSLSTATEASASESASLPRSSLSSCLFFSRPSDSMTHRHWVRWQEIQLKSPFFLYPSQGKHRPASYCHWLASFALPAT